MGISSLQQLQIRRRRQCAVPGLKMSCLPKTKPATHICLSFSHNRHRRASAPQEEENCQAWLHPQPVEMCLHQAAQNRHQLEERGPQIPKGSLFLTLHSAGRRNVLSFIKKAGLVFYLFESLSHAQPEHYSRRSALCRQPRDFLGHYGCKIAYCTLPALHIQCLLSWQACKPVQNRRHTHIHPHTFTDGSL